MTQPVVNPEDALSIDERLVRISGRLQAYWRWSSEHISTPERDRLVRELFSQDVPWLLGLAQGLRSDQHDD